MARADDFELLIKMNRLPPPSVLTSPLPVKFKEVHYDPMYTDDQLKNERRKAHLVTKPESTPQPLTEHIFFKDPLCPPELAAYDKEESGSDLSTPAKLGRNMRASHGQLGSRRRKGVCDLMNERKKILHQQKEQQAEFSRETDSEQLAAVLVNDMMQQGFHITPPEQTPRGICIAASDLQSFLPSFSSKTENKDGEMKQNVLPEGEERQLMLAIHREVKRVTGSDVTDEAS